jgi:archaellum biogenesis ATPase FlaH
MKWWRENPSANPGIVTGEINGILVVDIDAHKGGLSSWEDLQAMHGRFPDTPTVLTPSGGNHLYLKYPRGYDIRNSASAIAPGIDIRGNGGQVVAPPSVYLNPETSTLAAYRWELSSSIFDLEFAEVPQWLLTMLVAKDQQRASTPFVLPETIPEGSRNSTLFSFACAMRAKGCTEPEILSALRTLNQSRGSRLDEKEVVSIAHGAMRYPNGAQTPDRLAFQPIAQPEGEQEPSPEETWIKAAAIKHRKIDWLWPGRIALGEICLVEGDPGHGKSTLSLDLAATVSNGGSWPDGTSCPQGAVLICSAEDSAETVIKPRLMAAGANHDLISVLQDTALFLPKDLEKIETKAREVGAKLVIIDPLNAFLGADIDGHKDQHVRRALKPMAAMAQRLNAAIIIVRHLNKSGGNNVLYRGGGSIGLIGAARSGFLIAPDPDDPSKRIFANSKNNLAPTADSLAFELVPTLLPTGEVTRLVWQSDPSKLSAKDLLGSDYNDAHTSIGSAEQFLTAELSDGPVAVTKVFKDAADSGISKMTLRRAREALGVVSNRESNLGGLRGQGGWSWSLPDVQDAHPDKEVAEHLERPLKRPNLQDAQSTPHKFEHLEEPLHKPKVIEGIQDVQEEVNILKNEAPASPRVQDAQGVEFAVEHLEQGDEGNPVHHQKDEHQDGQGQEKNVQLVNGLDREVGSGC